MTVALGCDHGGFALKQTIAEEIRRAGHGVLDCGAFSLDPLDDYPDFARAVGEAIQTAKAERGILVCGSGVGAAVAATKMRGIRAAVCHDTYSAHQGVEHDDMNVLCLGARIVGIELARELVRAFLSATFPGGEKYERRLEKITAIESEQKKNDLEVQHARENKSVT